MQNAAEQHRATVFGLQPWEALFLPLFIAAVAGLASDGVHGWWDVIVAVAVGLTLISFTVALIVGRRDRPDREPVRQDWLLTVFVIALTVLFLIPDDTSDRAIWPWTAAVVVAVTGLLLVAREAQRRGDAKRVS